MAGDDPYELNINHIITYARSAAVDVKMTSKDDKQYAFSDVYQFSELKNPKIKEMTSTVLEV